jgi:YbbR domain-containing protein
LDKAKSKEILIRLACLLASFILWLYVSNIQNPLQITKIRNVPVEIVGQDALQNSNLAMLSNNEKPTVTLTVKGNFAKINSLRTGDFKLKADLSGYALNKDVTRIPVEVENKPDDVEVMNGVGLFINITLDDLIEKNVSIDLDMKVSAHEGFKDLTPVKKLTSAVVRGPKTYVDKVNVVKAKGDIKDLSKDEIVNLPLVAYDSNGIVVENVTIVPDIVEVSIPVRKIKTVQVNVKTKGSLNSDSKLNSVEPLLKTVKIMGTDEALNSIDSLNTEPIDLSAITESKTVSTSIIVPQNITLVDVNKNISVKVSINTLGKTIQKSFDIDITFNNPNTLEFKSDVTKISVVLSGTEDKINAVKAENIKCTVNLENAKEAQETSLPIDIKVPDGVVVSSYTPQNVKVTANKKAVTVNGNVNNSKDSKK